MEKNLKSPAAPAIRRPPQVVLEHERARAFWCREFSCTEAQLRQVVETVGNQAKDVRAHFWKTRHTRRPVSATVHRSRV